MGTFFRNSRRWLGVGAVVFLLSVAAIEAADGFTWSRQVGDTLEKATVWVIILDDDGDYDGHGSGFVVGPGLVMTNKHVANNPDRSYVVMNDTLPPTLASLRAVAEPEWADFAVLAFEPPEDADLPALTFNLDIRRMDRVSVWGYPGMVVARDRNFHDFLFGDGMEPPPMVFTEGTVSAVVSRPWKAIIHSAAVAEGNSGDPLVNSRGEVVGINTFGFSEYDQSRGVTMNGSLAAEDVVGFMRAVGLTPLVAGSAQPGGPDRDDDPDLPADDLLALAEEGDAEAQYQLGSRYYDGAADLDRDPEEAERWFAAAAEQDYVDAVGMLGLLYITRDDNPRVEDGLALMERAAEDEDDSAFFTARLAVLYQSGECYGVPRDGEKSLAYASAAAEAGNAQALAQMAEHHYLGELVERDPAKALELVETVLEADSDSTLAKAVMAHLLFDGEVVEQDYDRAQALALEAAEYNEGLAQGLLAIMYYYDLVADQDGETMLGWAERGVENYDPFALLVMGELCAAGEVVERDPALAWAYMTLGTEKLDPQLEYTPLTDLEAEMSRTELAKARRMLRELQVR